ncbi:MAG: DUF4129 domain-containing protein [bacterium]|nr:DUF4129 domain-containing protein [bacterium]
MIGDTAITVVDPVPRMWLDSLAHESEFSYAPTFRPMSWWDRFWHWVQSLLSSSDGTNTTVDTGLWVVLAVLIVVLIFFLLRGARRSLKHRNLAVRGEAIDVDDIATEDINGKIEAEIAAKRWRSAIRYLYLRTLQDLQDVGSIEWKRDKTNRDYLREVTSPKVQSVFAEAIRVFERTWYGNERIDEESFRRALPVYDAVRQSIRTTS